MRSHFVMEFLMLLAVVVVLIPMLGENTALVIGAAGALFVAFLVVKLLRERREESG